MTEAPDIQAPKRTSYHHGDLRAQLIEATRELVELKGADHFSVSQACRVAGVSTAAPYKHFKDKDEMLAAVALQGMLRQSAEMEAELDGVKPGTLDRIVALGRVYVRFATREPGVFRLMFGMSDSHEDMPTLIEAGAACFGIVQREIALFYGRDEVAPSDVERAFSLWSFVHGVSFLQIDGKLSKMDGTPDIERLMARVSEQIMLH